MPGLTAGRPASTCNAPTDSAPSDSAPTMSAPTSGQPAPALARVIGLDPAEFGREIWARAPHYCPAGPRPHRFADLFSAAAVDELLSVRGLRTPFVRVARNGATVPERDFTAGGGVGAAVADQVSDTKLLALFAAGSTIVLQGLHRTWEPLIDFSQLLAADLGHPVQINAYVTPPANRGFADHYDTHDVFVLQIAGAKRWHIREPVLPAPGPADVWNKHAEAVRAAAAKPPLLDLTLRPGDSLYLPRGYLHAATALGTSIHLTVGVHPWTGRHVAERLVALLQSALADDPQLRESLPLGIDIGDPGALASSLASVRSALSRALAEVDGHQLAAAMAEAARGAQRPAPVRPIANFETIARLHDDDELRLREHLAARLQTCASGVADGPGWELLSRAGRVPLNEQDAAAVRLVLERGGVRAGELGLDLATQLIAAGVLAPAGPDAPA